MKVRNMHKLSGVSSQRWVRRFDYKSIYMQLTLMPAGRGTLTLHVQEAI
jgi:hypothetical protein